MPLKHDTTKTENQVAAPNAPLRDPPRVLLTTTISRARWPAS